MTLRENFDYIVAKVLAGQNTTQGASSSSEVVAFDGWTWAYEYMTSAYMDPIMEAFDDDGSGFVTIDEVNRFVKAMPSQLNWRCAMLWCVHVCALIPPLLSSLPHWIAFWAIGTDLRHESEFLADRFQKDGNYSQRSTARRYSTSFPACSLRAPTSSLRTGAMSTTISRLLGAWPPN